MSTIKSMKPFWCTRSHFVSAYIFMHQNIKTEFNFNIYEIFESRDSEFLGHTFHSDEFVKKVSTILDRYQGINKNAMNR